MTPLKIGITLGDPAGIGPEVARAAAALETGCNYEFFGDDSGFAPGSPSDSGASMAFEALESSVRALKAGTIDAVVTAPICKASMHRIGFHWPGHTEYFAEKFGVKNYAMLLTGDRLTVALVTIHEPICNVPKLLTQSEIVRTGHLTLDFLKLRHPGVPRLAVAGLNPHAGEFGSIGREEVEIISPAVEQLRAERPDCTIGGPFSPDAIFRSALEGDWDAVLCMYHDQGLIPLKLHAFDSGVNVTLGLPAIRTSPDHGTAFALAGKGMASCESMRSAIRLAIELAARKQVA